MVSHRSREQGLYNVGMIDIGELYLAKAQASLSGAHSELEQRRFDNAANRACYACFQAAVAALIWAGLRSPGGAGIWDHGLVQARFVGDLINRRKLYPTDLRGDLYAIMKLRHRADYHHETVGAAQASRAVRRADQFVSAVAARKRREP